MQKPFDLIRHFDRKTGAQIGNLLRADNYPRILADKKKFIRD